MEYIKEFNEYSFDNWFKDSKIVNTNGTPKVVYHQTNNKAKEGIYKKGFDISKGQARLSDNLVPEGFFFKENDSNIQLSKDNTQLKFYLSIQNPLIVKSRDHVLYEIGKINKEFLEKYYKHDAVDKEYKHKFDELFVKHDDQSIELTDDLLDEWKKFVRKDSKILREMITKTLIDNGYDGMIIEKDVGSFGRVIKTIIALYPNQIKSIDNRTYNPNSNKVNENKNSI